MHAIVMAGGAPRPEELLYAETQGHYKALLDIQGKAMIQWVLDAFSGSRGVESVLVVGLPDITNLHCTKPMTYLPETGGMLENIRRGVQELNRHTAGLRQVILSSSDIPAITPEMVDWLVERVEESDHDLYYNVIQREVMEARFPGSRRSYLRLKDMEVCGGDINAINARVINANQELYDRLLTARKSVFRQASLLGYDTLLSILLRQLGLQQAAEKAGRRLGVQARAIVCPYAEIGMDVDKPHQLEIMRAHLAPALVL